MTPEPARVAEWIGPMYAVELPPLTALFVFVWAAIVGVLMILRRRYPGLTPILIALLILMVPIVLGTLLIGVGSGFED